MFRFIHLWESMKWYASLANSKSCIANVSMNSSNRDCTFIYYYKSSVSYYSPYSFNTLYYKYQFYWKKKNTYLFITLVLMYIIILFMLGWMSTLLDHSYLFILRCSSNESRLRWWYGRWWRSKIRLKQEERVYLFESFFRNKK